VKISLSQRLNIIRDAPRGYRGKLARRLLRSFPHLPQASTAEDCEFASLFDYQKDYARMAKILRREGKTPPAGEKEFLHSMIHRSPSYPGAIGMGEYFFLTAFVSILAPQRVIEIGTLTGFSAAIVAAALGRQHGKGSGAVVDTIDAFSQCLIDEARPTGFEIQTLIPDFASMVRLHVPHDATFVAKLARPNELEIVFIDADHRHPSVLRDVLRVAPYVHSGGWVILHDIQLGTIGRQMKERGESSPWETPFGAEWLFDRWPFRKFSGGQIGAIQLPNEKRALITFALNLMEIPFEVEDEAMRRARQTIYKTFLELN
jgi:Methyltransferase domain